MSLCSLIYNNKQGISSGNDLIQIMNIGNQCYSSLSQLNALNMFDTDYQLEYSESYSGTVHQDVACIADETKPRYSPSANQRPKACSAPPHVLPVLSIIGSNGLLHIVVLSCTVIGRVDVVEPWLRSRRIPDMQNKRPLICRRTIPGFSFVCNTG